MVMFSLLAPIWYQQVSLCLSNPALAGRADVNLTPESFKGGRSLVGMLFHPVSHDCKGGVFVILKPLLTDQSIRVSLGIPPFTGHHEYATLARQETVLSHLYQLFSSDSLSVGFLKLCLKHRKMTLFGSLFICRNLTDIHLNLRGIQGPHP